MSLVYFTIFFMVCGVRAWNTTPEGEICAVFPRLDLARGTLTTPGIEPECDVNGGDWCPTSYIEHYCVDGCRRDAVSCWLDQTGTLTYNNCNKRCRWCYNQLVEEMRCQANHYECMMDDRIPVAGSTGITYNETLSYERNEVYVTKSNCTLWGGLYCPNPEWDYYKTTYVYLPWCIKPQPSLARCYKKQPPLCGTYHDNEYDCHQAGCVWCENPRNPSKCVMAADSDCANSCCEDQYCMVTENADEDECLAKGCQYCEINGKKLCRFGIGRPECLVDYRDNCFYDGSGLDATEDKCNLFPDCIWCPKYNGPNCFIDTYPEICNTVNPECKKSGITDSKTCKLWGCEWCGIDADTPCIESTTCTDCDCQTKVLCDADTEEKCELKMCKWCNDTNECISINSEGVCELNTPSPCTQECGCGTSFIYDPSCTDPYVLNCPRIYFECNTHPCPEPDICPEGELRRYENPGTCCMSHTRECGRNTLNDVCIAQEVEDTNVGGKRTKRVINGEDIETIKKWPWLLVFYPDGATKCSAVLISETHALTTAQCVTGFNTTEMVVHLGTYDRSQAPAYTDGISNVHVFGDIAVLELRSSLANTASCVSPICMPRTEQAPLGKKCIIAGWGLTNASDPDSCSPTANDKAVKILPWHICNQAWSLSPSSYNDQTHVCASVLSGGGDACTGDLGGPLMCQRCENCAWYLEGVITENIGCGVPNKPTIFTRVANYENPIEMASPRTETVNYSCEE